MKIADIVSRKNMEDQKQQVNPQVEEAEALRKRKAEIEEQFRKLSSDELFIEPTEQLQNQQPDFNDGDDEVSRMMAEIKARELRQPAPPQQQPQPQPQRQRMPQTPRQEVPTMQQQQNYVPQQGQQHEIQVGTFGLIIFLDNGQKLPIRFKALAEQVPGIIEEMELRIEAGKVITIGGFKVPGNKILYIDLETR